MSLVLEWNKTHNLISKNQEPKLDEHVQDSLSITPHLGRVVVDLGSGGGLPGIPIAIKEPKKRIILVESNQKKAAFLLNTANKLNLTNVRVINGRIEELDLKKLPSAYDIVTRAVGTIEHTIKLTHKHLDKKEVKLKLMKTADQINKESVPQNYTIKKILKIPTKGKDKSHILVTIEKEKHNG